MTPPNYFRWIKTGDSTTAYDGYTLRKSESFEASGWTIGTTAPSASDSRHTETFLLDTESGGTWWDETDVQDA